MIQCKSGTFVMLPCFCLSACLRLPDVPHAHVSEETKKSEYQQHDVIHFTCEPGYTSYETSKYVCTHEGWLTVRQETCYCELSCFTDYCCCSSGVKHSTWSHLNASIHSNKPINIGPIKRGHLLTAASTEGLHSQQILNCISLCNSVLYDYNKAEP